MLDIAVVGCGYWGPNLIRNFNAQPDCRVSRVCDLCDERLDHVRRMYPQVAVSKDFDEVAASPEVDAVVVATPVRFHFEMARKALENGKHVFIEKPMAASTEECLRLIEAADANRLTLFVGHTFIYSPPVRKIRELVKAGALGEIHYVSARRLNLGLFQTDINVAWDLAPHDISIILHVLDETPVSVNCQGKAHVNPGIEDVTNMTLNFANGGFATIQSSWLDPNKIREMTFVGSRRMLAYDDMQPMEKIKIYDKRVEVPPYYDTFADFHYSYHYGDMYSPYLKQYEPLREEAEHFVDCVMRGHCPETSGREGLEVVRILEAATASLRNGGGAVALATPAGARGAA